MTENKWIIPSFDGTSWSTVALEPWDDDGSFCKPNNLEDAEWTFGQGIHCGVDSDLLPRLTLYQCKGMDDPWMLVRIDDFFMARFIYVSNTGALMELLFRLVPVLHAGAMTSVLQEVSFLLPRIWRMWHGHAPQEVCRECDPQEFERRRELALARARKQAAASRDAK